MKIGINCLQFDPASIGGLTSYTLGLLGGFANVGDDCRFRVYATPSNQHMFDGFRARPNFEVVVWQDPLLKLKRRLCQVALLTSSMDAFRLSSNVLYAAARRRMDEECDVVYVPTPVLQWFNSARPSVLSMHDIQQVHHPEFFSWQRRLSRHITYGLSARYSSHIQASSNFIKRDLLAFYRHLCPEQIEVIPSGVTVERFNGVDRTQCVRERYGLPERYLFNPAQLWPHKNHITLLRALKELEHEQGLKIPLVLTGASFAAGPEIFRFLSAESMGYVRYLGKVPSDDMVGLYQGAACLVTSTLHESSSLPILEAAAAGRPIIASRIPAIEELAETLQINMFDPLDVQALKRALQWLWDNEEAAMAQAIENRRRIPLHSWDNTARKYLVWFRRIVASGRGAAAGA